jgi:hypothetical protein
MREAKSLSVKFGRSFVRGACEMGRNSKGPTQNATMGSKINSPTTLASVTSGVGMVSFRSL